MRAIEGLTQRQLDTLEMIQSDFPLVEHPFLAIGEKVGASENDVFDDVWSLVDSGIIRYLGGTFNSYALGYSSTLCALAADGHDGVDAASAIINSYPGVTHNYERSGHYNVWFTLIAPSREAISATVAEIAQRTGCPDVLELPATKVFKIKVDFDLTGARHGSGNATGFIVPSDIVAEKLDDIDKELVRIMQDGLPRSMTPFSRIAEMICERGFADSMTSDEVIARLSGWKTAGMMRRCGAILAHRRVGFDFNAMGVWNIPDEDEDRAGMLMSTSPDVSHCYSRLRTGPWTGNLYTMIHGRSEEECEKAAAEIVSLLHENGIECEAPLMLYSWRELKKVSMKYFVEGVS